MQSANEMQLPPVSWKTCVKDENILYIFQEITDRSDVIYD